MGTIKRARNVSRCDSLDSLAFNYTRIEHWHLCTLPVYHHGRYKYPTQKQQQQPQQFGWSLNHCFNSSRLKRQSRNATKIVANVPTRETIIGRYTVIKVLGPGWEGAGVGEELDVEVADDKVEDGEIGEVAIVEDTTLGLEDEVMKVCALEVVVWTGTEVAEEEGLGTKDWLVRVELGVLDAIGTLTGTTDAEVVDWTGELVVGSTAMTKLQKLANTEAACGASTRAEEYGRQLLSTFVDIWACHSEEFASSSQKHLGGAPTPQIGEVEPSITCETILAGQDGRAEYAGTCVMSVICWAATANMKR
jgi:hypothetical protein